MIIETYDDLVAALTQRRRDLNMSNLTLEAISGIQTGYVAKLENWREPYGRVAGAIVLPLWLGGLGVALQLVELPVGHRHHREPLIVPPRNRFGASSATA